MKSEEEKNKLNEPPFPYHRIVPSSLEEQEQLNREYSLKLNPVERLAYLLQLNINAYGRQSLAIKTFGNKIIPGK